MADRTARLEELRKITSYKSIVGLEKCTELDLTDNNLTSVPLGVCDLTGLVMLYLHDNQFSSLPPEISRLTALTELSISNNPIEELPPQITVLTRLSSLNGFSLDGGKGIKRVPRGITTLPLWRPLLEKKLQLLDTLDSEMWNPGWIPSKIQINYKALSFYGLDITSLPENITHLTNLTYLYLRKNNVLCFIHG